MKKITLNQNNKKMLLIFLMLPIVFCTNEIAGIFIGGILVVMTVFCSLYFNKYISLTYITLSMLVNVSNTFIENITINQAILRSLVFLVTLMAATVAGQVLRKLFKIVDDKKNMNIEFAKSIVLTMVEVIDAKDNYLNSHSKNVCYYTRCLAEAIYDDPIIIEKLCLAALLHDIGKLYISSELLNKTDKLTDLEWQLLREHSVNGVRILDKIPQLNFTLKYVKYHHVFYDGNGYPENIAEESIPEDIGIIPIADAFDAMTTDRPYRKAMTIEAAYLELKKYSGSQFNPKYVDVFLNQNINVIETENPPQIDFNLLFG